MNTDAPGCDCPGCDCPGSDCPWSDCPEGVHFPVVFLGDVCYRYGPYYERAYLLSPFFERSMASFASQPNPVDRRCLNVPRSRLPLCPAGSGGDASVACTVTLKLINAYTAAQRGLLFPLDGLSFAATDDLPLPMRADLTGTIGPLYERHAVAVARSSKQWRRMAAEWQRGNGVVAMVRPMPQPKPASVSPPPPGLPPRGRPPAQPRP
jgi:hypothetical protein